MCTYDTVTMGSIEEAAQKGWKKKSKSFMFCEHHYTQNSDEDCSYLL